MNKRVKKIEFILLIALILAFFYNSYFLVPDNYRHAASKYLKTALYFPADVITFYNKTLVVFAPHCDDEVLGCGGAIRKSLTAGAKVYVVLVTNGDGFKYAAEAEFRRFNLSPQNYIKFAYMRQQESISALSLLGLGQENIFFLGYPDRGIKHMWEENWDNNNPYFSLFTGAGSTPYANSFTPNAQYCGESLLSDIEKILYLTRPDIIYLPHSLDAHVDHWSTNCFVNTALEKMRMQSPEIKQPEIYTYLVHCGNWPVPSGKHLNMPLIPPAFLQNIGTEWEILPLGGIIAEEKYQAIRRYKTQLMLMKNYLFSFARENELFGIYPPVKIAGDGSDSGSNIIIINPIKDTVKKRMEQSSALEKIFAREDKDNLYITVKTVKKTSPKTNIKIYIMTFNKKTFLKRIVIRRDDPMGRLYNNNANLNTFTIPLKTLGYPEKIFLGAETYYGNSPVDRSAYRMIDMGK